MRRTTTFKWVLILFLGIFFFSQAKASHVPGANITYTCVGPNQYQVTLTLFEDCGTAFQSNTALTIYASNTCGFTGGGSGSDLSFILNNTIYQQEVSQLCPTQIGQSECAGGTLPGVYMHQWQGVITLPGFCNNWTFWYSLCCRNNSTNINGAGGYDIYVETLMNSVTENCNNSPVINAQPIPYVCVNQPVSFSMSATDADGDSLVYTFIDARNDAVTPLPYNAGYTSAQPIPGATIDPQTGVITFTPTVLGNFVFAVQIAEYDSNGNLIGYVVQDFQFEVINCANIVPEPPAGGISNVTGQGILVSPTAIQMCEGDNTCFDLVFTDDDVSNILTITSNIATAIPSATVNTVGTNPVTVSICYTAQAGDPAFTAVTFTAEDNACPIAGINSFNISINIVNTCCQMPISSTVEPACQQSNGSITATGQGTTGPWDFEWELVSNPGVVVFSQNNVNNSTYGSIPAGTYQVTVTDTAGCERVLTITLTDQGSVGLTASSVNETCAGDQTGSITVTGTSGTSPYDIVITNTGTSTVVNNTQNTTNPVTQNGLTVGTYLVEVTDATGCQHDTTITITAGITVTATATSVPETCFQDGDAQINANGSGGTGPYTYIISGQETDTTTTGNFTDLSAGNYVVLVVDANGCADTTSLTINNTPAVIASATATPTVGMPPLDVVFTNTSTNATNYTWIFGDGATSTTTSPSHTYVEDSVFTAYLIASNGPCVDTISFTITTLNSSLFIPNVFSPNGDGNNDLFEFNPLNIVSLNCKIFNRWGLLVAEITSPTGTWDGKSMNGNEVSDGTYFYLLEVTAVTPPTVYDPSPHQESSTTFTRQGTVTKLTGK
jgi:gliding motility-associated-like protein